MTTDSLDLNIVHRWDDSSLQLLYRHFYKALVAFAIQAVETQESAEEIVQDIFVKTWQKRNTLQKHSHTESLSVQRSAQRMYQPPAATADCPGAHQAVRERLPPIADGYRGEHGGEPAPQGGSHPSVAVGYRQSSTEVARTVPAGHQGEEQRRHSTRNGYHTANGKEAAPAGTGTAAKGIGKEANATIGCAYKLKRHICIFSSYFCLPK